MLTAAMADWDGLPQDFLAVILEKITLIEDFIAFGMVCKSWHMAFVSNKSLPSRHQIPWLMLPEKEEDHPRRIFSLSKQNILAMNLYIPEMSDRRCIGLNYGWVLTISSGEKGEMSLLHPLSRSQIKLPLRTSIAEYLPSYVFRSRAALSADPSKSPSDFVLMILYNGGGYLGYWRSGDREWTRVELQLPYFESTFSDITYYQDRFYAISSRGEVWSFKISSHEPIPACRVTATRFDMKWPYIVGSAGGLLVLGRIGTYGHIRLRWDENCKKYYPVRWGAGFQVYELDLIDGRCKYLEYIGDKAIFVGYNTSISLDSASRFPGVKSNHIYYIDDHTNPHSEEESGKHMGFYNLQNRKSMPLEVEESSSPINPPFWFIPSL